VTTMGDEGRNTTMIDITMIDEQMKARPPA
jgi:hypothetical protein